MTWGRRTLAPGFLLFVVYPLHPGPQGYIILRGWKNRQVKIVNNFQSHHELHNNRTERTSWKALSINVILWFWCCIYTSTWRYFGLWLWSVLKSMNPTKLRPLPVAEVIVPSNQEETTEKPSGMLEVVPFLFGQQSSKQEFNFFRLCQKSTSSARQPGFLLAVLIPHVNRIRCASSCWEFRCQFCRNLLHPNT